MWSNGMPKAVLKWEFNSERSPERANQRLNSKIILLEIGIYDGETLAQDI